MNEQTTTGEAGSTTTPAAEESKTFSQADVNRIVQERLAKERTKGDAAFAQREQELAQRELLLTAKERLTEKGLPLELLGALNVSSPEAMEKSLSIIEKIHPSPAPIKGAAPAMHVSTAGAHDPESTCMDDGDIREAMGLKHEKE